MAYTTINKSTDYFNAKIYTGTGSSQSITGVGFQPDFTWIKQRSGVEQHVLFDAIRGVQKYIASNTTAAESTTATTLTAFNSDGFTEGGHGMTGANGSTYASWNWKANGAGSSNTDGSIATTVSVNTTAGFSIGTCSGLATNNDTLGHGLGAVPKMIMVKNTQSSGNWFVYHHKLPTGSVGQGSYLNLNEAYSYSDGSIWNNTAPTSSVFTMKGGDFATGESLVFYAFAEKTGYSKFGSFVGNGNDDGTFVYTGFKPSFILLKNTSISASWLINDNKRPGYNANSQTLVPNNNDAENTGTDRTDFLSNGFKLRVGASTAWNGSGNNIIYMAFAEAPLVGSNNVPCTAR